MDLRPIRAGRPVPAPGPDAPPVRGRWRQIGRSWPLGLGDVGLLLVAFLTVTGMWVALGALVTGPLDSSVGDLDQRVAEGFVDARTPFVDDLSWVGSMLAETVVKITFTAVVVLWMIWRWMRWREALFVVLSLVLEAACFLAITLVVGRPRPDVPRLDSSPVDSSFPSGHVAAAVVYGALVVVVFLHTSSRWWRTLAITVAVLVVGMVAWSRLYRGMHHLSDVIAGILLGAASMIVVFAIVERAHERWVDRSIERELRGAARPGVGPARRGSS